MNQIRDQGGPHSSLRTWPASGPTPLGSAATAGVDVARRHTDAPQDGAGVEPAVAVVTAAAAAAAQRPVPAPAAGSRCSKSPRPTSQCDQIVEPLEHGLAARRYAMSGDRRTPRPSPAPRSNYMRTATLLDRSRHSFRMRHRHERRTRPAVIHGAEITCVRGPFGL